MPDLSVIIPIYNTPLDKLERCLRSVLSLEACNYEVLLIDDGSKEPVGNFCTEFIANFPQFRYVYKENGGASSARNMGICEAKGRYLTFLDADDILLGKTLVEYMPEDDNLDMLIFDMLLTQRGNTAVWHGFDCQTGSISRQQLLNQLFTTSSISGPCAKLYKTQLLQNHNFRFNPDFIAGEDWMFVCDCALQMDHFFYCRESCYQYFREDATGQSRTTRFPDTVLANQLSRFLRKQQVVANELWTEYEPSQILSLSASELIEGLFNSASELLLVGLYTKQRKKWICEAVTNASTLLANPISKKTQLKLWVLIRCPAMLWPLAKLRALYLRHK